MDQAVSSVNAWQRTLYALLGAEIRAMGEGAAAAAGAVVFAMALGAVHALTPGHGKAVVFTYFVGSRARAWAGMGMACRVAIAHVVAAAVLVAIFGSAVSMFGRPSGAARWLQAASYAAITVMGLWFLLRAIAEARRGAWRAQPAHAHTGLLPFAVGLLPCPMTMLVLTYALANASLAAGALLTVFLGLGIAATISAVGSLGILVRRGLFGRIDPEARLYRLLIDALQIGSALIIALLGAVFLAGALG